MSNIGMLFLDNGGHGSNLCRFFFNCSLWFGHIRRFTRHLAYMKEVHVRRNYGVNVIILCLVLDIAVLLLTNFELGNIIVGRF